MILGRVVPFQGFINVYNHSSASSSAADECCRGALSEAVDGCICYTRKIQHGRDWERSRSQGQKNAHNFLMTVRPLNWACGYGTEMLLILKKLFSSSLLPDILRYDSSKKCPTILYAVNLWLMFQPLGLQMGADRVWWAATCNHWRKSHKTVKCWIFVMLYYYITTTWICFYTDLQFWNKYKTLVVCIDYALCHVNPILPHQVWQSDQSAGNRQLDRWRWVNSFSVGTVFIRQNLTSVDVRFWRIKTVAALKEL